MGYMRHHAILVTTWDKDLALRAYDRAKEIFNNDTDAPVSPLLATQVNRYHSFFVAPDGSKEGWDTSDQNDEKRKRFIEWLQTLVHEDGSTSIKWAEVQFGDEDGDQRILNSNA